MFKPFHIFFTTSLLIGSLIFSCNQDGKRKLFGKRKYHPASLIRNHLLFSDLADEYSFPVWFNDSLIKMSGISKITRIIYPKRLTESARGDSLLAVPSEIIDYTFSNTGSIEKISHAFYFDDRKISQYEYYYSSSPDSVGFSNVKVVSKIRSNDSSSIQISKEVEIFNVYDLNKNTQNFSSFKNRLSGDFLYSITNKNLQGPLEIDKRLRPNPNDRIVFGNMYAPNKIYQVENKVNERNVVQFHYKKGSVNSIRSNQYPFHSTRHFTFDKRGYCTGFVDSTFSENSFLTRTLSSFENNRYFSPTKIFHRKENSEGKLILINYEEFVYEFQK